MVKYVVVEFNRNLRLIEVEKATYTPQGWHKPYAYFTFDSINKAKKHPAEKRKALVHVPGLCTYVNNVRVVSEDTTREIDAIDAEILVLKKRKLSIIYDRFRTFPLVKDGDLNPSHDEVFQTRQEAEKA